MFTARFHPMPTGQTQPYDRKFETIANAIEYLEDPTKGRRAEVLVSILTQDGGVIYGHIYADGHLGLQHTQAITTVHRSSAYKEASDAHKAKMSVKAKLID